MINLILFIIGIIVFYNSCQFKDENIVVIEKDGNGVCPENVFSSIYIFNDSTFYIGGEKKYMSNKSVLYKTENSGESWNLIYEGEGNITDISVIDSCIILNSFYYQNGTGRTDLLVKHNSDENFQKIDYNGEFIRKGVFFNEKKWMLFACIDGKEDVIISNDSGNSWRFLESFKYADLIDHNSIIAHNNEVFGLFFKSFKKDSMFLFSFNCETGLTKEYNLLQPSKPCFLKYYHGDLFLITQILNDLCFYKINYKEEEIQKPKKINLNTTDFLIDIFLIDNFIIIITNNQGNLLNNYKILYKKSDEWVTIDLPEMNLIKPYFLFKSKLFFVQMGGTLRIVDFIK